MAQLVAAIEDARMSTLTAVGAGRPRPTPLAAADRRRHQRVKVNLLGRFMLVANKEEYPCQVVNMSPGGAALVAVVRGDIGDRVIAYIDHIGRVEGKVARHFSGGFAISFAAPARKRDKLADQLTWLANRDRLNLQEDRRHARFVPKNPFTTIVLPGGQAKRCRILDVSLSGAAVAIDDRPRIGAEVSIGKVRARVVRHLEEGIALEFANVQTPDSLARHIAS